MTREEKLAELTECVSILATLESRIKAASPRTGYSEWYLRQAHWAMDTVRREMEAAIAFFPKGGKRRRDGAE